MAKCFAFIGCSVVAGLLSLQAQAQSAAKTTASSISVSGQNNVTTTAVPFLRISPDARAGAMGDVGIAITPDANSQYWNVGAIPFCEKKIGISATYTPWLKDLVPDIFLAYISGYYKFGEENNQAISASMRYFSLGDINFTNDIGDATGTGKPREYSFDLGYSRRLSPYFSTGVSLRYIHSAIATGASYTGANSDYKPGNAFAADFGIYYTKTKEKYEFRTNTFSFGAVLSNLGSKISYTSTRKDFIPINLGIGAAYTKQLDEYKKVTFAMDLNKLVVPSPQVNSSGAVYYPDKSVVSGVLGSFSDSPDGLSGTLRQITVSTGVEFWYQNQIAFRAGYFYEDKFNGDRQYLTCGLGAKYNIFNLNFSYLVPQGSGITRNPLSNTLRFSLLFEFDKLPKSGDGETPADATNPQ